MGLNWSGGFAGASKGMETIIGVKGKSIDILYDEITRENRQRFEAQQAQLDRDFKSEEAFIAREWESGEARRGEAFKVKDREDVQEFEKGENVLDREIDREKLEVEGKRLDQQIGYQNAMLEDRSRRTDEYVSRDAATSDSDDTDATLKAIAAQEKIIEEATGAFAMDDAEKAAKIQKAQKTIEMLQTYGSTGYLGYERIMNVMKGAPSAEQMADAYASMDPETRKKVDARKVTLQKSLGTPAKAYAQAIYEQMSGAEKPPEQTRQRNPRTDASSEAYDSGKKPEAEAPSGGIPSAMGTSTVDQASPPKPAADTGEEEFLPRDEPGGMPTQLRGDAKSAFSQVPADRQASPVGIPQPVKTGVGNLVKATREGGRSQVLAELQDVAEAMPNWRKGGDAGDEKRLNGIIASLRARYKSPEMLLAVIGDMEDTELGANTLNKILARIYGEAYKPKPSKK